MDLNVLYFPVDVSSSQLMLAKPLDHYLTDQKHHRRPLRRRLRISNRLSHIHHRRLG